MTDTAKSSVNHIVLSDQELKALNDIIRISCDAFKLIKYPLYYDCFLMNIYNLIQLGNIAVVDAMPLMSYSQFSVAQDKLSSFLREMGTINHYKFNNKRE